MRLQAAAFLAAFLIPSPADGQDAPTCNTRDNLARFLAETHGEARIATGLSGHGSMLEVFASAGGETWSIIFTSPGGSSCLVAFGEIWRQVRAATVEREG